jgi:hypothetical protein
VNQVTLSASLATAGMNVISDDVGFRQRMDLDRNDPYRRRRIHHVSKYNTLHENAVTDARNHHHHHHSRSNIRRGLFGHGRNNSNDSNRSCRCCSQHFHRSHRRRQRSTAIVFANNCTISKDSSQYHTLFPSSI